MTSHGLEPSRADEYARALARTLRRAAGQRHAVHACPDVWQQEQGRYAFGVDLCDGDDLPAGLTARVVVTVTDA
jgi:hypothetical protein